MTTHRAAGLLCGAALAVAAFAAVLVLRADLGVRLFDVLGFGPRSAGVPAGAATEHILFAYSVLGAVLLGWMVLVAVLAAWPMRRARRDVGPAVIASLVVWFVADTGHSLVTGNVEHAAFNVVFLVLLGGPCWAWWSTVARGAGPAGPPPRWRPGTAGPRSPVPRWCPGRGRATGWPRTRKGRPWSTPT